MYDANIGLWGYQHLRKGETGVEWRDGRDKREEDREIEKTRGRRTERLKRQEGGGWIE